VWEYLRLIGTTRRGAYGFQSPISIRPGMLYLVQEDPSRLWSGFGTVMVWDTKVLYLKSRLRVAHIKFGTFVWNGIQVRIYALAMIKS
jgi:hypothetical protein